MLFCGHFHRRYPFSWLIGRHASSLPLITFLVLRAGAGAPAPT